MSAPGAVRSLYRLLGCAPVGERLEFEDGLVALLDEVVGSVGVSGSATAPNGTTRGRHRDLVEAAPPSCIATSRTCPACRVAEGLACSPFHLSRVFAQVTGLTLRAYCSRLRTRAAAERLTRGSRDLTSLALSLGYADHSHFTNAFRREWGVPPSAFRRASRH